MRDTPPPPFDLDAFLPYLLNQAAEASSHAFATIYRREYGMTRTQWRVMANLGKFGAMSATEICRISHLEKTMVSRAVSQLERDEHLSRAPSPDDKRREVLSLTTEGRAVFAELGARGMAFQAELAQMLGAARMAELEAALRVLIAQNRAPEGED